MGGGGGGGEQGEREKEIIDFAFFLQNQLKNGSHGDVLSFKVAVAFCPFE